MSETTPFALLVCAGRIAVVVPPIHTHSEHHKTRCSLQKLLAKEEIELDKLFPQKRRTRVAGSPLPFISPAHRVSSGPNRSLSDPPSPLLSSPLLCSPPPVTSHVWTGCDHPGRPGVCKLQGGVSVRGRLEQEPGKGGHHGVDPGSGRGEVRPQN